MSTATRHVEGPRPATLTISLGGLAGVLRFADLPPLFADQLHARYGAFLIAAGAAAGAPVPAPLVDIAVDWIPAAPASAAQRARQMEDGPLVVTTADDDAAAARIAQVSIRRWDFSATLTAGAATDAGYQGVGRCEINPHSFDCLLRVIWSVLLPQAQGALLHACGVRTDAGGVVFPGVSERGKTTLARKVPNPDDVLSDELVIVRARADGDWQVYGTPFWGDFQRGGITRHGFALRGLAFLEQDRALSVAPLPAPAAALRLLECWLCFETDDTSARRNLALAVRMCRQIPIVEMRTRRETPVDDIVHAIAPYLRHAPLAPPPTPTAAVTL